jgi:asparagine synthase (glutamine-hydrolysing)
MDVKVRHGKGKWLIRRILDKHVPREMIERPKMGFGVPIGQWLAGPLRDWAESLLDARRLASEGLLDPGPIRAKWDEHLRGQRDWQHHLWSVLMFQAWHETVRTAARRSLAA